MGMFDSLYDADDVEWQTKAFDRNLDVYRIGDTIPADCALTCQVEVMRYTRRLGGVDAFANIRSGVFDAITFERDDRLPLIDYGGRFTATTTHPDTQHGQEESER